MAMRVQMIIGVPLVVLLLNLQPAINMASAIPTSITPAGLISKYSSSSRASIYINNFVLTTKGEVRMVEVSCEGPAGQRLLPYGGHYSWDFALYNSGNKDVRCAFDWGFKFQEFVVWVDPREMLSRQPFKPCLHCVWDIQREGFYVTESGERPDNRVVYKWLTNI